MSFPDFNKTASAVVLAIGAVLAQPAVAVTLDFDGIAAGADANSDPVALAAGISFHNAVWLPDLGGDGIEIPGSEHWQVDSAGGPARVENTLLSGWGTAPSGPNALDARWSPVLLHLSGVRDIAGFSFTLPDSFYGNLFASDILFLDAAGNTLYDLAYFQGQALATISLSTQLPGVQAILLASGTFYDNISVTAVPVPGAAWLFGSSLAGIAGLRRRKA